MKTFFEKRYHPYFTNTAFVLSILVGFTMLLFSFVLNFYAGTYATRNASASVNDIVLSNIPVYNVDDVFVYGPLVLWLVVSILCVIKPKREPFVLKSIALFLIIRSAFVVLTHIGPFPDQIVLDLSPTSWFNRFSFGGDLFFSAHTGLPFLMALVFWRHKILRVLFIITAIFFGIIVLLGHLHYSIDVLSAFFITYTIYHISEVFFTQDKLYFDQVD